MCRICTKSRNFGKKVLRLQSIAFLNHKICTNWLKKSMVLPITKFWPKCVKVTKYCFSEPQNMLKLVKKSTVLPIFNKIGRAVQDLLQN